MHCRSSFLKIRCLDFTPIVFEVGSYWFRIGAYCYEAIIINNVFYCFCQGETFEKVCIFGSCLRRKQPSEYPLLLTTQRLVLFSPVYFFSYCSRPIVFVIFLEMHALGPIVLDLLFSSFFWKCTLFLKKSA